MNRDVTGQCLSGAVTITIAGVQLSADHRRATRAEYETNNKIAEGDT